MRHQMWEGRGTTRLNGRVFRFEHSGYDRQNRVRRTGQGTRWVLGFGPLGSIQNHRVMPAAFLYHFSQRQSGRAGRLGQDRIESIRIVLAQIRRGPEPQVWIA